MREILFRGKRLDNGEWETGSLMKVTVAGRTYFLIFGDGFAYDAETMKALAHGCVDPATVGQYTGLKDKNGKRIFEGDIVRVTYAVNGREKVFFTGDVKFEDGAFYLYLYSRGQKTKGLLCGFANAVHTEDEGIFCGVVGNIHDNPELLEGGEIKNAIHLSDFT